MVPSAADISAEEAVFDASDIFVPKRIGNPIREKIAFGDITVRGEPFIQLPYTIRETRTGIQYLIPVPDDSGRLTIIDTTGKVYLVDAEGENHFLYLDLTQSDVDFKKSDQGENGLRGIAFHPNFARPGELGYGRFYTAYTAVSNGEVADYLDQHAQSHYSVVREWVTDHHWANEFVGTSREILRVGQFNLTHNVGNIGFNPNSGEDTSDFGMLYIPLGDGGDYGDAREQGQSKCSPLGAILRIDPFGGDDSRGYGIPTDNPFLGRDDAIPEIWAYGLRNPQHFSWDTERGLMFITDIGQNMVEEVNLGIAGANYGWRLREGSFATSFEYRGAPFGPVYPRPEQDEQPFVYPITEFDHDEGNAVGNGFVYRGKNIPALQGKYVFSELVRGRLLYINADTAELGQPQTPRELRLELPDGKSLFEVAAKDRRVDLRVGMDGMGELYLLTKQDGWVRKLVAKNE